MNMPDGEVKFVPKQALSPTPQLYDELVSDSMENLAKLSLSHVPSLPDGAVFNDNGCGTGAGSAAIVAKASELSANVSIKGTDINDEALKVYRQRAVDGNWSAEAIHMDSNSLSFPDSTFTHIIGNALIFVVPNDGVDAMKEMYRTLKPGGVAIVNSWAYVPNMDPLEAAAKATRPAGTPLPRAGLEKWEQGEFLRSVIEQGGFNKDKVKITKGAVQVTTSEINRYATMLWSFIGGTTPVGWLRTDEENWDKAIETVKQELKKTDGYKELGGGKSSLTFVANIAIATK
ncbi:MAG: hypothetical protein Q9165_008251 [Trypethelium subeluteriae]